GGKIPVSNNLLNVDKEALAQIPIIKASLETNLSTYKFREALKDAMNLARLGNKYLTETEPWKIAKTDMERVATILNVSLQICANLSIAFEPFLPFSSKKLRDMLNITGVNWEEFGRADILLNGHQLNAAQLLFAKVEDEAIEAQIAKLNATKAANEAAVATTAKSPVVVPQKEECTFDEFAKMDIRTATVLEAVKVPKTDKLLQLTIDTGIDKRTIVSGIAEHYTPQEMVGKQICILANLAPRKIKGIESKGMILMAKDESGNMKFVTPAQVVDNGAQIN
ncbi:MAG: methionine--tRNA ligase subunit beta, partial [Bacteroidales bacterium]